MSRQGAGLPLRMSQEEIKTEYALILERREDIHMMERDLSNHWDDLRRRCTHPDSYTYYAMGEEGVKCPDCGYQT